jgi:peptide methionine sulfoxide reductase MsrA
MALITQIELLTAQQEPTTKRVAFGQHCFWTGEMKLGQIEGVVRTEAGYIAGRKLLW